MGLTVGAVVWIWHRCDVTSVEACETRWEEKLVPKLLPAFPQRVFSLLVIIHLTRHEEKNGAGVASSMFGHR